MLSAEESVAESAAQSLRHGINLYICRLYRTFTFSLETPKINPEINRENPELQQPHLAEELVAIDN
jgi:hypothetical protein